MNSTDSLREGHGARQIQIEIHEVAVRWSTEDAVLATYEELHVHAEYTTVRQTTVLLTPAEAAPGGYRWRHVHETWKLPPPHRR